MKKFTVLLPIGHNLEEAVKEYPEKLDINYLKYILYYINSRLGEIIQNPEEDLEFKDIYAQFPKSAYHCRHDKHKKHIKFLCGKNFKFRKSRTSYYKRSLLYKKPYEKGVKSYSYKLCHELHKNPLEVDYINDSKLISKIKEYELIIPPIVNSGKYKFLKKFFSSDSKLEIELNNSLKLSEKRLEQHKDFGKYLNEC